MIATARCCSACSSATASSRRGRRRTRGASRSCAAPGEIPDAGALEAVPRGPARGAMGDLRTGWRTLAAHAAAADLDDVVRDRRARRSQHARRGPGGSRAGAAAARCCRLHAALGTPGADTYRGGSSATRRRAHLVRGARAGRGGKRLSVREEAAALSGTAWRWRSSARRCGWGSSVTAMRSACSRGSESGSPVWSWRRCRRSTR